jgi:hypothetical protein
MGRRRGPSHPQPGRMPRGKQSACHPTTSGDFAAPALSPALSPLAGRCPGEHPSTFRRSGTGGRSQTVALLSIQSSSLDTCPGRSLLAGPRRERRQKAVGSRQKLAPRFLPPTAYCLLPTAYCLPATTEARLHSFFHLEPKRENDSGDPPGNADESECPGGKTLLGLPDRRAAGPEPAPPRPLGRGRMQV